MEKNIVYYPLTHPQKAVWLTEKLHPGTSIGNVAGTLRFKGEVDFLILEKAINKFIETNDSMRLRVVEMDGEPRQYIAGYEYGQLDYFDFSDKELNELYKWDMAQTKTPFELVEADLFYFAMIKISELDSGFYIKCHHLIADAWSMSLLGSRIVDLYSAYKKGEEISEGHRPSYIDYIVSENEYKNSDRFGRDREYWHKIFEAYPEKTVLKESGSGDTSIRARRKTMLTPKKLTAKIAQYCAENKTSVFSLFIAALSMYINRVTAKEDIILGTTTLNRLNPKEKETAGMFNNITPMRINISDEMNFNGLIEGVSREGLKLLRHQKYPYDLILKEVREKHRISENIFNIVLIYQNSKFSKDGQTEEYSTRWHFNGYQVDSLHISINDRENEGHLIIDYDYQTDLFHAKEIDFIHQNIINVLWHALDNPVKKISKLEMLSEKEKYRILHEFNRTKIIYNENFEQPFEETGRKIPEKARCHILDKNLNLLPIGIAGELYISGAGLSARNLKALGLSEKDAVLNPYKPGDLLYRSGCIARWFPDGDIMYFGKAGRRKRPGVHEADRSLRGIDVNVISTFTAEPVEGYIKWWGEKFGHNLKISFAGYNQVFQELLNPNSRLSENKDGINVALVRFEDFIRYDNGMTEETKLFALESADEELKEALNKFGSKIPFIVAVFPVPAHLGLSGRLRQKIEEMNDDFIKAFSNHKNIFLLDFNELQELYSIQEVFDPLKDREGHMPFTEEYYAAMGTELARKICAIRRQDFKVIVLDCDNTLWKGICGEQGASGVKVAPSYRLLQQFVLQKNKEGMLLAVCSKNNHEDVLEVFEKNPEMVLNKSNIVSWKVNWKEKSRNIAEIAHELNLGLDSFIFVDDDSLECSKMVENCPEVFTLQLPSEEEYIPLFLKHVWAFDRVRVTKEDALRSSMYEAEKKRKEFVNKGISLESFMKGLKLEVSMRPVREEEMERAAQLTQRTNQFNLSAIRRDEDEIGLLLEGGGAECFVVEATDKFGEYGIIGLVIVKDDGEKLFIDTLVMSCRIFGRNVEDIMLAGIGRYAREIGRKHIEAVFVPTEKNKPVGDFIERMKWVLTEEWPEGRRYRFCAEDVAESVEHIQFYYKKSYGTKRDNHISAGGASFEHGGGYKGGYGVPCGEQHEDGHGDEHGGHGCRKAKKTGRIARQDAYFYSTENIQNTHHKEYVEPLNYLTGRKLLKIAAGGVEDCDGKPAAEKDTVAKLLSIWQSLLKIERAGKDDDFFNLGGDSLSAVILISRLHKEFGIELTLRDVFTYNTVNKLSRKLMDTDRSEAGRIAPVGPKAHYELSSAQKRMYILNRIEKDSTGYNECHKILIQGKLDINRLEAAFREFIRRHEAMRTGFEMSEDGPVQKIYSHIDFSISCAGVREKDVDRFTEEFIKPFDLSKPPLIRAALLKTGKERYILLLDIHHIIIDGASFGILIREIQALYEERELKPQELQYKDFACWQNAFLKSEKVKKQEEYWREQFKDEIPVLNMPTDHLRPAVQSFDGGVRYFALKKREVDKLKQICNEGEATLFMVLFAAFHVLLHRYTGQEDIVAGIPVSGRRHEDVKNIVGMFVNTLPVRTYPRSDSSFLTYLKEVKETLLSGLENQDYQYESLIELLKVRRELNRNPLFDVMFSMQNTDMPDMKLKGLTMSQCRMGNQQSKFDISLLAAEKGDELEFKLEYCKALFEEATMARLEGHFLNILKDISAAPQKALSEVEMLGVEEKHKVLYAFNNTEAEYGRDKTIHQLFEEQAERTPDHIAVVFEGEQLTYSELNAKANRLAALLRNKGVKPQTVVAIMVERSLEMIIGILAILKAGGAYLPIDPEYPEERIRYMLENSRVKILICEQSANRGAALYGCKVVELKNRSLYTVNVSNLQNSNTPGDLAYVIYTSGSTGNPKGVMIEHHSVVNRIQWMQKKYPIDENSVILQKTTFTFDVSVWELFWWSLVGARLCFLKPKGEKDPEAIITAIEMHGVTTMHFVPSMLNMFLKYVQVHTDLKRLSALRQVFASGEALNLQHVNLFNALLYKTNKTELINLYGPTEATVDVSYFDCSGGKELEVIPIGKPIDNTSLYVLDNKHNLQPIGIPGELYIGGVGLARGYMNNKGLTDERFVANPFKPEERLYKTGDLARWNANGDIEYLGRLDHQVKIRGFRVELNEIEKLLLKYKGVKEAVVTAEGESDNRFLCAYIVSEDEINAAELKVYLSGYLPGYMIPSRYAGLKKIPLLSNGKVNRKELLGAARMKMAKKTRQKPVGEVQQILCGIFKNILNIDAVDPEESFFELGGDSLQTIKLTLEIYNEFDVELTYADIFNNPSVNKLSRCISGRLINGYRDDVDIGSIYMLLNEKKEKHIFAFPPITGFGLAFNDMAKGMSNYSLFAFNYIVDEDRLKKYLGIIKEIQPEGPYILLGFSAGAHIALEMAGAMKDEAVVIMMDGFFGDIGKSEIDKKVDFFIQYSKEYANITSDNRFLNNVLEGRIRDYMNYVAEKNAHPGRINSDIHFIQSEEMSDLQVESLRKITSKSFHKYKGYGRHFDLLKPEYIKNNVRIVEELLDNCLTIKESAGRRQARLKQ